MAQNTTTPQPFNYKNNAQIYTKSDITTYGAIILPFDLTATAKEAEVQTDKKETTKQEGKIKTAFKNSKVGQGFGTLANEIKQNKNVKVLTEYMQDKRNIDKLGAAFGVVGSKLSGIAVTQAIIDGKVTSREALDYLFMGFAPALGVQGSLMGYSGINQMKDALFNGSINVGAFVSGFRRTLKGATDLKDMLTKKDAEKSANILEFDLTISHNETYQSETPDRRVQSGQSLNEYVHNMPVTIEVQCALQENKRYSKAEFRAILEELRSRKETVQLVLGDEIFDSLILTNFNPSHDCTKSGMDYTLSFKRIIRSDILTDTEVTIQPMPKQLLADINSANATGSLSSGSTSGSGRGGGGATSNLPTVNPNPDFNNIGKQLMNAFTNTVKNYAVGAKTWVKASIDKLKGK